MMDRPSNALLKAACALYLAYLAFQRFNAKDEAAKAFSAYSEAINAYSDAKNLEDSNYNTSNNPFWAWLSFRFW
jgi:threonine/homoserine/homoserine lactone efflux protein